MLKENLGKINTYLEGPPTDLPMQHSNFSSGGLDPAAAPKRCLLGISPSPLHAFRVCGPRRGACPTQRSTPLLPSAAQHHQCLHQNANIDAVLPRALPAHTAPGKNAAKQTIYIFLYPQHPLKYGNTQHFGDTTA